MSSTYLDRKDGCEIMSRGTYSIFVWNQDSNCKLIPRCPQYPIPLMQAQKTQAVTVLLSSTDNERPIDEDPLFNVNEIPYGPQEILVRSAVNEGSGMSADEVTVQTSNCVDRIPEGAVVHADIGDKKKVSIVVKAFKLTSGQQRYKIRPLNSEEVSVIIADKLKEIRPDPADIPLTQASVDKTLLSTNLTDEDVARLWAPDSDSTVKEVNRIILYWHHRLCHAPLITPRRLSQRGVLPECISKVLKMPLCAACAIAETHRRMWKTFESAESNIRKKSDDKPGAGTSCDHIVSQQYGLMPQFSGILTKNQFWGSTLFVDHYSDFIYNHLITGTSSSETYESKKHMRE